MIGGDVDRFERVIFALDFRASDHREAATAEEVDDVFERAP